jgi:hypothetical protein
MKETLRGLKKRRMCWRVLPPMGLRTAEYYLLFTVQSNRDTYGTANALLSFVVFCSLIKTFLDSNSL